VDTPPRHSIVAVPNQMPVLLATAVPSKRECEARDSQNWAGGDS
jgi:hypothetical protein